MKKIFHYIKINKYTIYTNLNLTKKKKTKMENCHFCMPIIYFATALTFLHEVLRDRNSNFFVTKKYPGLSNNFAPLKEQAIKTTFMPCLCILLFMGKTFLVNPEIF